jgi:divalent metal cation (Fe/Co/Zn/Cd) transporter
MQIERHENGNIEVNISFVVMSYLALFGAFCCLIGIGYFWIIEGLNIFSIQIIGLVLAGVILGIAGVIIYESSNFVFDNENEQLVWQKRKYFRAKKGIIPFHDIKEVKVEKALEDSKDMLIKILTVKDELSLSDSYMISEDYNIEELVSEVKSVTGLSLDVSPKNRAKILLDLGETKGAIDIIREEMDMSMEEAKDYLGI